MKRVNCFILTLILLFGFAVSVAAEGESIRITYANFIEFCQFGEWAYEKLAVLDCNSGNVAVISPDRRLQTAEEIEIFLSEHCGYHLSEINWMVMKGDVLFLNENDF